MRIDSLDVVLCVGVKGSLRWLALCSFWVGESETVRERGGRFLMYSGAWKMCSVIARKEY